MKRISFFLIVLPLLMSCKNPSIRENTYHLYKDFPFSETLNFVRPKDPAFEASFGWVRGKRYPALATDWSQIESGRLLAQLTTVATKPSIRRVPHRLVRLSDPQAALRA